MRPTGAGPAAPATPRDSPWRSFGIGLTLIVLVCVAALFASIGLGGEKAIEAGLHARAEALFNAIVLARSWNAAHGGVLVEKTAGMVSNPYLVDPDVKGVDGKTYTRKNPALMAREMSEIAERNGHFRFHITSLRPINPANAPDAFEERALAGFARGRREEVTREARDGVTLYRYMAPLYVVESCLGCHGIQGYTVGEVRGGISVSFDMGEAERAIARNRWTTAALFLLTAVAVLATLWWLVAVLHRRLDEAEARIRELAITDELTGLRNRRHVTERLGEELARAQRYGETLSCVLFDVDRFKGVNDTFGHDAGDAVLREVSAAARAESRQPDVLARWGGEEFLLVLPRTDAQGALAIAARLREVIEALRIPHGEETLRTTASFGVATAEPGGGEGIQQLLRRADEALYRAKDAGRNRVELAA